MEINTILSDFNKVSSDLVQAVESFDENNYNKVPFEGSWTPGQVTQHIILANDGFSKALNADVAHTERAIDELIIQLKTILLNYELKMDSPDFIMPELKDYDREEHLSSIVKIKQAVLEAINSLDLSKTCLAMELPGLGKLTRLEAIYFVIYHTERHTHQLNEIHKHLQTS